MAENIDVDMQGGEVDGYDDRALDTLIQGGNTFDQAINALMEQRTAHLASSLRAEYLTFLDPNNRQKFYRLASEEQKFLNQVLDIYEYVQETSLDYKNKNLFSKKMVEILNDNYPGRNANVGASMLAVEYGIKLQSATAQEFQNWVKVAEMFAEDNSINNKVPFSMFDTLRYFRFFNEVLGAFSSFKLPRDLSKKVITIPMASDDKASPCLIPLNSKCPGLEDGRLPETSYLYQDATKTPIETPTATITVYIKSGHSLKFPANISIVDLLTKPEHKPKLSAVECILNTRLHAVTLPFYPYDTIETLRQRLAVTLNHPKDMIKYLKQTSKVNEVSPDESLVVIGKCTFKELSVKTWTYNPLELTTLIFTDYYDIVTTLREAIQPLLGQRSSLSFQRAFAVAFNLEPLLQRQLDLFFKTKLFLPEDIPTNFKPEEFTDKKTASYDIFFNFFYLPYISMVVDVQNANDPFYMPINAMFDKTRAKYVAQHPQETFYPFVNDKTLTNFSSAFQRQRFYNQTSEYQMSIFMSLPNKPNPNNSAYVWSQPVKQLKYTLTGKFSLQVFNVYQLFNNLPVSDKIPYARIDNFVKAVNNRKLPTEWNDTTDEVPEDIIKKNVEDIDINFEDERQGQNNLVFYMISDMTLEPVIKDNKIENDYDYVRVEIQQLETTGRDTWFEFFIETSDVFLDRNIYVGLSQVLPKDQDITLTVKKIFYSGLTIIQNLAVVPEIFMDFALNNKLVRETFIVNERNVLYRKFNEFVFTMFIAQQSEQEVTKDKQRSELEQLKHTRVKGTLKLLKVEQSNSDAHRLFRTGYKTKPVVWALTIENVNRLDLTLNQVQLFANKFVSCLNFMARNRMSWLYNYYCSLVSNLPQFFCQPRKILRPPLATSTAVSELPRDVAPEVFLPNYSRTTCSTINSMSVKRINSQQDVDEFVRANPNRSYIVYPPEEQNQLLVSCTDEEYPHVVLVFNKLYNNTKYPLVPCCRKDTNEVIDKWNEYKARKDYQPLNLQELAKKIKEDTGDKVEATKYWKTDKICKPNTYGKLYPRIKKLLNFYDDEALTGIVDPSKPDKPSIPVGFFRYGVVSKEAEDQSFFWSILAVLNKAVKKNITLETLAQSVNNGLMMSTLQYLQMTVADAVQLTTDRNRYIDPRLWLPLLRDLYQIEIILFMQDKHGQIAFREGGLYPEYFQRVRLVDSRVRYDNTVIVLVHNGADTADNLLCPHAELIAKVQTNKNFEPDDKATPTFVFKTSSFLATSLINLLNKMYPTSIVDPQLPKEVYGQTVDTYGFTRSVTLKTNTNDYIRVYTEPLANVKMSPADLRGSKLLGSVKTLNEAKNILQSNDNTSMAVEVNKGNNNNAMVGVINTATQMFVRVNPQAIPKAIQRFDLDIRNYPVNVTVGEESRIVEYYFFIKVVNYLKTHLFWFFSLSIKDEPNPEKFKNFDVLRSWFEANVAKQYVGEATEANRKPKPLYRSEDLKQNIFSLTNPTVFAVDARNGMTQFVIRCNNDNPYETLYARLQYLLHLKVIQSPKHSQSPYTIFNYHKLIFVPNYYVTAKEFKESTVFTVFNSPKEYELMTSRSLDKYLTFVNFSPKATSSFFVQLTNPTVEVKVAFPVKPYTRNKSNVDQVLSCCTATVNFQENDSVMIALIQSETYKELHRNDKIRVYNSPTSYMDFNLKDLLKSLLQQSEQDELYSVESKLNEWFTVPDNGRAPIQFVVAVASFDVQDSNLNQPKSFSWFALLTPSFKM